MPFQISRPARLAACTLALMTLLSACGGGGGDGGTSATATSSIDDYIGGTVTRGCGPAMNGELIAATNAPAYVVIKYTFTKKSATEATGTILTTYYAASNCSGSEAGHFQSTPSETILRLDGIKTVGSNTVDKVSVSMRPVLGGFITGSSITFNGVYFPTPSSFDSSAPTLSKDIWHLDSPAGAAGDLALPRDTDGYPSALSTTITLTKS